MTHRLYYADGRAQTFDAVVESCAADGDHFDVRLDRTAFYPTSGGQPFDMGTLIGVAVIDVIDRDDRGITHVIAERIDPGTVVHGAIDWPRRRDHMQQHTGQHVLSAAFEATGAVPTVGFHMGADVSTIDLAREVSAAEIAAAELEANRVIWEDRMVNTRIVPEEDVPGLALRRQSTRSGPLRIVEIEDFDLSACGGTHVARTGEIGIVAASAWERVRGGTRVSFLCGARVLNGYRQLRDIAADAGRLLSVATRDIGPHIDRLQQSVRDAESRIRGLREELVGYRSAEAVAAAETIGPHRVVIRVDAAMDAAGLKQMAHALIASPGLVVVLAGAGDPTPVVVARSGDVAFDAGAFMKGATTALGGRGGGRAEMAQGGIPAPAETIAAYVRRTVGS